MLAAMGNRFAWRWDNYGSPDIDPGIQVLAGLNNAEGSWYQVATASNISTDVFGVLLWISYGYISGVSAMHLLDIGTDPAGGTNYTARINNIACGSSEAAHVGGRWFYFPLKIKAGSSVAVRVQGKYTAENGVWVAIKFFGKPSRPEMVRAGWYSETIGAITNSNGVSFTPGSASEGAWTSLGTTTRKLWWWQLCVQCDNATVTALYYFFDLAWGNSSNKHMIIENMRYYIGGSAETASNPLMIEGYCEVPAGGELFVRGHCSGTPVTGWNAVAVGIGG